MYRIGEFSLLNKVTIKTLRYYDDIGLFKPKVVDSFTGYRYYDDEQQEEFENIILYKDLGFSLEEILKLKCENKESVIIEKISELTREIEDDKHRIRVLKEMIGGDKMNNNKYNKINVEYKKYLEKYKIGKIITLKNRNQLWDVLDSVSKELDNLKIHKGRPVLYNFELGYETEDIDAFVGYEVDESEIPGELIGKGSCLNGELEVMLLSKLYNFLVGNSKGEDIDELYQQMIKYAHENDVQIRGSFVEIYDGDNVEIYVEAFDLKKEIPLYQKDSNKYEKDVEELMKFDERDDVLVGKYTIREILPDSKYMFNKNKQKSMLDTKYKELILNKDGTTNYDEVTWNNRALLIRYEDKIIIAYIYPFKDKDDKYLEILMNENFEYYKTARPMCYIYTKK